MTVMDLQKKIYTLGTSTRKLDELLSILNHYSISAVVDVRRFPRSRLPWFHAEKLKAALEDASIVYIQAGDELGGYRKGGYEAYMRSEEFERSITRLEQLALRQRVAILCAERFAWRCHRRFIGDALRRRGWQVIHIMDIGKNWQPQG